MDPALVRVVALLCLNIHQVSASGFTERPNIIFIIADDLGWNDVGWHNPDIKTPHIDRLARKGVILNSSYVQPICTPSRSAFLTGVYPFRMGLQNAVITDMMPRHLPSNYVTLPQKLKQVGYSTHLIGKWHLGFCNWSYTPTHKGFDSFYGFYKGSQDYYDHTQHKYYDFRFNETVYRPRKQYSTDMYAQRAKEILEDYQYSSTPLFLTLSFQSVHTPLQAPWRYSNMYRHIKNKSRRIYSGMVTAMDAAIGKVVESLKKFRYMRNTLIVFTTDNGGAAHISGNNLPLRGSKNTIWEGGTRAISFAYSKKLIRRQGRVHNGLFHAVDWYPTILAAAGVKIKGLEIDGINQWPMIRSGKPSRRKEFIYNLNSVQSTFAIRRGDYKLIMGYPGKYSDWYPLQHGGSVCGKYRELADEYGDDSVSNQDILTTAKNYALWVFNKKQSQRERNRLATRKSYLRMLEKCKRREKKDAVKTFYLPKYLLYNIKDDPTETTNLASKKRMILKKLLRRLNYYRKQEVPQQPTYGVPGGHPRNFNGVWSPGWC